MDELGIDATGVWLALHTSEPSCEHGAELAGGTYARAQISSPRSEWSEHGHSHTAWFTAPTDGARITHAAFTTADGETVWLDMTTDPPTPCDPPEGWTAHVNDD